MRSKVSWVRRHKRAFAGISCALALAFAPALHAADTPVLEVNRFVIEGDNPLSQSETDEILKPYLGPHSSLQTLEQAAAALEKAVRARGNSFHRVIVPAQQPTAGELTLRILPFTLDRVTVVGNQHFTTENILRSVPGLKPGRAPDVRLLGQQLSLANEHPSKRVTLQIKEGTKPDAVDADLRVADVAPSQFFVSLIGGTRDFDNTLNRNTGYTRLTLGYQHSNLFNRDHTATIAYTTSPDHVSDVTQIGVFYTIPFYGYNTMLSAYYTHSDIDSGSIGLGTQSFDVSGSGDFYGIKATYLLPRFGELVHNVSIAYDSRYFESNVAFGGTALPATAVGSRPITFRYAARMEKDQAAYAGFAEYSRNIPGGRAGSDTAYMNARLPGGAERDWSAFRYGLDGTYSFGARWSLSGRLRGQYTDDPLIPGEQLGIAGITAVRGFREREVTGDRAYFVNLEANGPAFFFNIAPFAFFDFGWRKLVTPVTGASQTDNISSAGAGLRWKWQGLDLNVAYAHVTNGVAFGTPRDHDKLHFTAFYRF
ncbi:MAG TPA: ShlB/FhaC/HecB family hemolysin secretion/activation protein [Burkholderiales bacterium]|nr:ShlB/FhaC/HecB family hemolysin secretion/activation protein [Burkholderiales bacterium]